MESGANLREGGERTDTEPSRIAQRGVTVRHVVSLRRTSTPRATGSDSLNAVRRTQELARLGDGETVDLLVVGGGITGAWIALDAATRGLSVALVERGDLANGTSRWSSKLAHGGLRYLAHLDFGLAWESASERAVLMGVSAPHLIRAMPFLIPLGEHVGAAAGAKLETGIRIGDRMRAAAGTSRRRLPPARRIAAEEARTLVPAISDRNLRGALLHWDAQLEDDARLVLAVARTAAAHGARILTYVGARELRPDGATVTDERTGQQLDLKARHVVNATGVWAGELAPQIELRPSIGSHLLVRAELLGEPRAGVSAPIPGSGGSRFAFAVPRADGLVLIGITDEPYDGDTIPDAPAVSEADETFLLRSVSRALERTLTPADVVGRYAGLRPLLAGAADEATADLSRRHAILGDDDGVLTVVGGKLTTARRMAQDAVDQIAQRPGVTAGACITRKLPLVGATAGLPTGGAAPLAGPAAGELPPPLVRRYGAEAARVAALARRRPVAAAAGRARRRDQPRRAALRGAARGRAHRRGPARPPHPPRPRRRTPRRGQRRRARSAQRRFDKRLSGEVPAGTGASWRRAPHVTTRTHSPADRARGRRRSAARACAAADPARQRAACHRAGSRRRDRGENRRLAVENDVAAEARPAAAARRRLPQRQTERRPAAARARGPARLDAQRPRRRRHQRGAESGARAVVAENPAAVRVRRDPRLPDRLPGPARRGEQLGSGRRRVLGRDRRAGGARRRRRLDVRADGRHRTRPALGPHRRGRRRGPYLGSVFSTARVRGFQGDDYARPDRVAATAKHWVAYGGAEAGRDYNTVDVSDRRLRELYFPPFRAAVDAGVATFMTSFNEINGVPATANPYILRDVLRREWGFDGTVVSDYTSIRELIAHGVAADDADAAQLALNAGTDIEMVSRTLAENGERLVAEGRLSEATIDEAVRHVLRLKYRLGLFDRPYVDESREAAVLADPEHRREARRIAGRSMVLLKNDGGALPLSRDLRKVALVGPLADSQVDMMGTWIGDGKEADVVTVRDGLEQVYGRRNVRYAQACDAPCRSSGGFGNALAAVRSSQAAVVVLGEPWDWSGEASSRSQLDLPGKQLQLLRAIEATGRPYVVVLMNGRPLTIDWAARHAPAIVEAWYPGTEAGNAVADVLTGKVNPGGKLPVTFPRNTGQIPIHYDEKPTGRPFDPANKYTSKYLDVDNTPLYPFGYGLSYTRFALGDLSVSPGTIAADGTVTVSATVRNVGRRAGDEVVQLYVRDRVASVTRPVRSLRGFSRVTLAPGQSRQVTFRLGPDDLSLLDASGRRVVEPGAFTVWVSTSSVGGLEGSFTVG